MFGKMMIAAACMLAAAGAASAQTTDVRPVGGTRLDVVATGEVTRVPDTVLISAGVTSQAPTATAAIRANGASMERLRAALASAGIAPRDIQTSSVNLSAEYRQGADQMPHFVGYRASHQLGVRFRDAANAGRILDTLVSAGANEINGPSFEFADSAAALDEARTRALTAARARAELYARSLGMRVRRILSVSEIGGVRSTSGVIGNLSTDVYDTNIALGEESMGVTLNVSFELE